MASFFHIDRDTEGTEKVGGCENKREEEVSKGGRVKDEDREVEEASGSEERSTEEEEEDQEPLDRVEVSSKSKWDCESILRLV